MQRTPRLVAFLALAVSGSVVVTAASFGAGARGTAELHAAALRSSSGSACAAPRFTRTQARHVLRLTERRLDVTRAAIQPGAYPSITDAAGTWQTTTAKAWTSGFFPGSLWLAYRRTNEAGLRADARAWTHDLAGQATDTSTHDVGFQIMSSFGNGYAITHDATYKATILRAATSLATRYNPTVGAIRSWGRRGDTQHFEVIIDNMMNLRLLFWASAHGGRQSWKRIATRHALTTVAHFIRPDGSVIHLVDFDPTTGDVLGIANPQGYSADSTWSRGQAWATYGFTTTYAATRNRTFLHVARRTADYFIAGLPSDCVPYWDFDAPDIPNADRDSSAAAIAAAGMLQLSRLDPDASRAGRYALYASRILSSLTDHYLARAGEATLTGSTATMGVTPPHIGTAFGDYYLRLATETWLRQHRR